MSNKKSTAKKNPESKNILKYTALALSLIVITAAAIIFIGNSNSNNNKDADDTDTPRKGNDIIIKTEEISEKAKFYPINIDGTKMEVIAVKAPDGTIRTAFNTCQVCYSSGRGYYKQEGNVLVCQNCLNRFETKDVEVTRGGCNPVPITSEEKTVTDTDIIISEEFLKQAKVIFANWKN